MRRGVRLGHLLFAAWLTSDVTACTSYGARPKCPASGGPTWTRIESPHFVVLTDLDASDADSSARDLESSLDALATAFDRARIPMERTQIVVFRNKSDFHAFRPGATNGSFFEHWPGDPEHPRLIFAHGRIDEENRRSFLHELTHELVHASFGPTPPWLQEGLAEYYSSMHLEDGKVVMGERPRVFAFTERPWYAPIEDAQGRRGLGIPLGRVPTASSLMGMSHAEFYADALDEDATSDSKLEMTTHYAAAWALVHMLVDGPEWYRQRFEAFLADARRGKGVATSLAAAFGDIPPERLDADFWTYLTTGSTFIQHIPYDGPAHPLRFSERPLSDAEVHLLWATITPYIGPGADAALADFEAAKRAAPDWPDAVYYHGVFAMTRGDLVGAERLINRALELSPDDPRFLLGLLDLRFIQARLPRSKGFAPLLEAARRLQRVARTAVELNNVANTLLVAAIPAEALPFAERAVKLAPFDSTVLDTLAMVLFELDRVQEAVDAQTRAVAYAEEHPHRRIFERNLARYRTAATAALRTPGD